MENENEVAILALAQEKNRINNRDLQDLLKLPGPTISQILRGLIDRGFLNRHGVKRGTYYTTMAKAEPGQLQVRTNARIESDIVGEKTQSEDSPLVNCFAPTSLKGQIKYIREGHAYGRILDTSGREWFFHRNSLFGIEEWGSTTVGRKVQFEIGHNDHGACAVRVKFI